GARVSIAMIADFLGKLFRLPLAFFDSRTPGDIMQRISDHHRVRTFLMSSALDVLFSVLTFIVFAVVLAMYSWQILTVFAVLSALSMAWLVPFLKRRRLLDSKRFELQARERDTLIEIIHAMPEIKIQGIQRDKRWDWEQLAARSYKIEARGLALGQA